MNRRPYAAALLACLFLLLTACNSLPSGSDKKRTAVLDNYAAQIRWNEFDDAWAFVDPVIRAERPLTDLERERYKQIRVVGYEVKHQSLNPDAMSLDQSVEIRVINVHNQVERVFMDHQHWTYDEMTERWWLASGLPDFSKP
jgi:hypothetical protein